MLGKLEWNVKKEFFLIIKDDFYLWDYCLSLIYIVYNKFKYKLIVLKMIVFIK